MRGRSRAFPRCYIATEIWRGGTLSRSFLFGTLCRTGHSASVFASPTCKDHINSFGTTHFAVHYDHEGNVIFDINEGELRGQARDRGDPTP